jgi:hypothetical protein
MGKRCMEVIFIVAGIIVVDGFAHLTVIEHQSLNVEHIIDVIKTDEGECKVEKLAGGEITDE